MSQNRRKPTTLALGSFSSGTLNAREIFDSLAWELDHIRLSRDDRAKLRDLMRARESADSESADELLDELLDELSQLAEQYAPAYAYVGAHPGDGADFGVWISESLEADFDGLKVSDTSEIPAEYTGEVLYVNDHGNCTLYAVSRGRMREVWSVV
jgi:hypothetical protein